MKFILYYSEKKLKSPYKELFEEYQKRLSPYCNIEIKKCPSYEKFSNSQARFKVNPKLKLNQSNKANQSYKSKENLNSENKKSATNFANLDLKSKNIKSLNLNINNKSKLYSSEDIAKLIKDFNLNGISEVYIFLNQFDSDNFDLEIGLLSFPASQEIAISVLVEQIFRAFTIIEGRPYHK